MCVVLLKTKGYGVSVLPNNQVTVVDLTVPVIEFNSERVLTLNLIDNLHRAPANSAYNIFRQNQSKLQLNKHYYHAFATDHAFAASYPHPIPHDGLILITQRGYSMLVKAFTDDFSWQVQEQLADAYFDAQRILSPAEQLVNHANMLVQHDQRINRLEETQHTTLQHLHEAKMDVQKANTRADQAFNAANAALQHKFGEKEFYTIMAFCSARSIPIDMVKARLKGAQAGSYTRQTGGTINKVPDERFGSVNSYHISVLEHVFRDELSK